MARIWSSGFELNSSTADMEFTILVNNGGATGGVVNTTVRSGTYALRSVNTSVTAGGSFIRKVFAAANANGPYYFRAYVRVHARPSALNSLVAVANNIDTNMARIRLATDGTLELWDTVKIGASSAALNLDQWYMIELYYFNNTVSAKLELDARLAPDDGSASVSFASTTTSTATGGAMKYLLGCNNGNLNFDVYIDDAAINDTTGAAQTSWAGPGKIIHLVPNAAGDANAWLNTAGGAGAATDWGLIDEVPPNDATDFINSGTLNDEDLFNASNSGIGASDTVNVVQIGGRFNNNTADATTAFKLEVEKTSGGTKSQSAAIIPNSTTWKTNDLAAPFAYPITLYADPDASAWTQATLDTMQIGAKLTAANVNRVQVTTIWALVDYTPAAAPPTTTPHLLGSTGVGR